jgi:hypothetical protein
MRLKFGPVRDVVLLLCGLGILGHEMVVVAEPRIALLTLAAGMIGLPATFLADRKFTLPGGTPPPTDPAAAPPSSTDESR